MRKILLVLMIIATLIMGCQRVSDTDPNNRFNPTEVQVGDEVAGLRIAELDVGDDGPNFSVVALFEGRIVLQGRVVQYEGHDFLGNALTFEVDQASSDKLPKLTYDDRDLWFAFQNREEAIRLLENYNSEGLTVEIDDYKIHYAPTEVVNEASIVRVIDGTKKIAAPSNSEISVYKNDEFGIILEYPSDWKSNPSYVPERFEGSDGFFQISAVAGGQSGIDAVADSEANHQLLPYGSESTIESLTIAGQEARIILPSADQTADMNNQACLIIQYPKLIVIHDQAYEYFQLFSNTEQIKIIGRTIKFTI